jgi:uncharacterized protein YfaT (DUF1175 family)
MRIISFTIIFTLWGIPAFAKVHKLNFRNSDVFRSWFVRIVEEQLRQGPSPKWVQRDCVGLVRYAVNESLKDKNDKWKHSHGFANSPTPPNLNIPKDKRNGLNDWVQYDGKSKSKYISAIGLIQGNTEFVSKNINQAKPGDLLFYDMQGSEHIMIWTGKYITYHTGTVSKKDNGLRKVKYNDLLKWKDSRWRPTQENPNFIGIFKLGFLSH